MPLTKLFQKRHSLKESSLVQETNKELEKLKSSFGASKKMETLKAHSESNLLASHLNKDASVTNIKDSLISSTVEEDMSTKYEYIEQECVDNSFHEKSGGSDQRRQSAPAESLKKTQTKTVKSASCSEQQSTSKTSTTRRRKCVSESQADNLDSNEKGNSERFQLNDGKLEDMIGQCINRIIKESILSAVKNVNVDGIYEEIIENIANRRHCSSNDSGTNSDEKYSRDVAEYVELDESSLNYKADEGELDHFVEEDDTTDIGSNSEVKKTETHSLGGYSADIEESMSVHSIDIELNNQSIVNESCPEDTNRNVNNILTVSQANVAKDINDVEKLSSSNASLKAAELLIPGKPESERTNVIHETEIADYSIKNDSTTLSSKTLEQEDDHQAQSSTDVMGQNFRNDKCEKSDTVLTNEADLMVVSDDIDCFPLPKSALSHRDSNDSVLDSVETLPLEQTIINEEKKTNNWKLGYLHVKLPHKERGKKGHLKAWKKRCVSIQTDEFVNDPKNPCLMLSLYSAESGTARKHGATFWKSISCHKAAVYRSSSRSHKYAFTIADDNNVVIHLAADSETASQEWMAAIRSILWPPSPVMQLEKMLNGKEFEISIVDNDFSFRAGLLGMYGYLTITGKKLILVHSQQGYVIQEWYLNTVDKFELIPQSKIEDAHKVLAMTTCSDSSTGKGEILMYCPEAVAMLQSIASTIHQILTVHIEQKGGKYDKELAEIADWLVPSTSQEGDGPEDYYKVPPRQVKSLLDIPNFIFDQPLTPSTTVTCCEDESIESKLLETAKTNATRASQDSGISAGNNSEDILNCSSASFLVGGGQFPGKSSDSELSDSYTPPRSPAMAAKQKKIGASSTLQVP